MSTLYHVELSIEGALKKSDEELDGLMNYEDGTPLTGAEARQELLKCKEKGWRLFPVGECPEFDHQTGCPGHPESEEGKL